MSRRLINLKAKRLITKKDLIIGIGVFLALFTIAGGVSCYLSSQNKKDTTSDLPKMTASQQKAYDAIINLNKTGDNESAIKEYGELISQASDISEKSNLLSAKSAIYFNKGDYENALVFAKQAAEINPTENNYQYLAAVYEKMGKNLESVESYKKAIELLNTDSPMSDDNKQSYLAKIKLLEVTDNE